MTRKSALQRSAKCSPQPAVAFSWNGLPQYAARLIRAAIDRIGRECIVVGTRPHVPIEGMEQVLGQRIYWVKPGKSVEWQELGLTPPDVFVQAGWSYPHFVSLGRQVKASGGHVIGISDANWRGDFRQTVLGALAFRVFHRRHFDAMIVPGLRGKRLLMHFGMKEHRIRKGLLGADPAVFNGGESLNSRERTFLYVGRFIALKDVLGLARAFQRFSEVRPGWKLRLVGTGKQASLIPRDVGIVVDDFKQPNELVSLYRDARFFVFPSKRDAWGLVVHEAALCGCALVLSDSTGTGSADDLSTPRNAIRFRAGNEDDLVRALIEAADRDEEWLRGAEMESRRLASNFGPARFADAVVELIDVCTGRSNRASASAKDESCPSA